MAWKFALTTAVALLGGAGIRASEPGCPGSIQWDGGGGTTAWATGTNWSTNLMPAGADDVCIPDLVAGIEVVHSSGTHAVHSLAGTGGLQVSGGTLSFAVGSPGLGQLTVSGGTLSGTGDLPISGPFAWSGGAMSGEGTTHVTGAAVSGSASKTLAAARILRTNGTTTWTGAGSLRLGTGCGIENLGTWDAKGDASITDLGGAGAFLNSAGSTFHRSSGAGLTVAIPFVNDGTVSVASGTLSFLAGSGGTGTWLGSGGTILEFGGNAPHVLAPGSGLSAGVVVVSSGSLEVEGSYQASTSNVIGGAASFRPGASVAGVGNVTVTGSSGMDFSSGGPISVSNLSLLGGTISGTDVLTISGSLGWSAGTMSGPGTTILNGGMSLSGSSPKDLSGGRVLRIRPSVWVDHVAGPLRLGTGARIENAGRWTLDLNSSGGSFEDLGGAGGFENLPGAIFTKWHTLGGGVVGVPFTNRGLVEVSGTTLQFTAPFTQAAGSIWIQNGILITPSPFAVQGGKVFGRGTIAVDVDSAGTMDPGHFPEDTQALDLQGDYTQRTSGAFLAGIRPDYSHDLLQVGGVASLAGSLTVSLLEGFVPQDGDTFTILTAQEIVGSFSTTSLPPLPGGLGWWLRYPSGSVMLEVGPDGDGDGVANAGDCAPFDSTAGYVPAEVAALAFGADKQTLSWISQAWTGSGTVYDAVRGLVSELPTGGPAETCLLSGGATPQASDATQPDPETAFYYLVRARNACGVGTYGTETGGNDRETMACP
ncbi:MAG TPA: hypothetical protein VFV75_15360 [Candidatus Polarisedimenticolaceae bacterium]|nr:hypothetical protein [Candidatus Polarisedimenticolaceae bacterium]